MSACRAENQGVGMSVWFDYGKNHMLTDSSFNRVPRSTSLLGGQCAMAR